MSTFAEYAALSVNDARILVQLDISKLNLQWVNCGAGIWYCNYDATYPEVDSSLLDGFTAQSFGDIGSVTVDSISYTKCSAVSELTNNPASFYYDSVNENIYICIVNYDEPGIHTILLGIIYGYSFDEFIPIGSASLYEGRLLGSPSVSQSRDPLYWGKMQFDIGGVSLINSDGYFDTFAESNYIYGNETRILAGYKQLNISDYVQIHSGTIQKISNTEEETTIDFSDKRMQLSKSITYNCNETNALDTIVDILRTTYGIQYNSIYYDTTAWAAARALVANVSIDIDTDHDIEDKPVIEIIEWICSSVFGLFIVGADNRFSFKIVDTSAAATFTIPATDILNSHSYSYDPSEVITSVKVGYDKNWSAGYVSPYHFYFDTTQEAAIYAKYKTYNQKTFYTLLPDLSDAQTFATTILNYAKDVHAQGELTVPMSYYSYGVGDIGNAVINREKTTMLGTKKIEIISKSYNLRESNITFGYRIV